MKARIAPMFRWAVLVVVGLPAVGQAQFSFVTNNGALTITGYAGWSQVSVPDMLQGLPVTSIADGAFRDNTNLNLVRLPNSVTNLGAYAFSGCISLYGVVMSTNLSNIGEGTFYNCFQLTGQPIPEGVTNIGSQAFFQCSSLEDIKIPDSVITIQDSAFEGAWRLARISVGNRVAQIGDFAFAGCSALSNLSLGTAIQSIGAGAFNSCSNLASVALPKTLTSLGSQAFAFCPGLEAVYFTGNAPADSGDAFLGDPVTFVDYLSKTTGWGATFGGAPAVLWDPQASFLGRGSNGFAFRLTGDKSLAVVIEASAELANPVWVPVATNTLSGGPSVFSESAWTNFHSRFYRFRPAAPSPFFYMVTNGALTITGYRGPGGPATIPDTVNGIGVTAIGNEAVGYGVTSIVFGTNVTSIAPHAFWLANDLTNVVLDDALTSIGSEAFFGAFQLSSVYIPAGVTNIGEGAFMECYRLPAVTVAAENPTYCTLDGVLFNKSQTSLIAFPGGKGGPYVVPNGVTTIVAHAFDWCTGLSSIGFPNTLRTIGDYAFYECATLTYLDLPASLAIVGNSAFQFCSHLRGVNVGGGAVEDSAFESCYALTNLTLGTNVTSIGSNAFSGCGLTTVTIPAAVTNIGATPFADEALTNIAVDALNASYRSVQGVLFDKAQTRLVQYPAAKPGNYAVPETVTALGDGAFWDCLGLTNVVIPQGLQYLGPQAFAYCVNLSSVTLPNGITNIASGAFQGCHSLTNVTLGTKVNDIGANAFFGCGNLSSITLPNSVTQIEPGAFCDCRALSAITLGNQLATVGYDAFADCFSLRKVIIESGALDIQDYAFDSCWALSAIYFTGDAPTTETQAFYGDSATVYYLPGTAGWGATLAGLPTVLWNPQILTNPSSFGVGTNGFGLVLSGSSNLTVVVESCTDLLHPIWQPVCTNTLDGDAYSFNDPSWKTSASRFYRVRSP